MALEMCGRTNTKHMQLYEMIAYALCFRIYAIEEQCWPFVHFIFISFDVQALQLRPDRYIQMCLRLMSHCSILFKGDVAVVSISKHRKWRELPVYKRGPFFHMISTIAVFMPCCNYSSLEMTTRDVLFGAVHILRLGILCFYGNTIDA